MKEIEETKTEAAREQVSDINHNKIRLGLAQAMLYTLVGENLLYADEYSKILSAVEKKYSK